MDWIREDKAGHYDDICLLRRSRSLWKSWSSLGMFLVTCSRLPEVSGCTVAPRYSQGVHSVETSSCRPAKGWTPQQMMIVLSALCVRRRALSLVI